MRLLNTTTLKLQDFMGNFPHYVILSHTWGEEEVTFDDICKPREQLQQMQGFDKILRSCELAKQDGFEWIWIDTCCIDKRSSAELSEAINSMYRWYWDAEVCYAYLVDVCDDGNAFENSRWFERGWTLQELLAPSIVEFYDSSWSLLGNKLRLVDDIEHATGIDREYILNRHQISHASIAARFSWASRRETTRQEDIAYCLLGLVSVNMPMMYGEKEKAFYRLQLEIVKQSDDHTIFAWQHRVKKGLGSIFAPSPKNFEDCSGVCMRRRKGYKCMTHEVVNSKLRITLPIIKNNPMRVLALLNCADERGFISLELMPAFDGSYFRAPGSLLVFSSKKQGSVAAVENLLIEAHGPVGIQYQKDHPFPCMRITTIENNVPPSMVVIGKGRNGREWLGSIGATPHLVEGDFVSFTVSFWTAIVGLLGDRPILELHQTERSLESETSLSRDWDRLRQRVEYYHDATWETMATLDKIEGTKLHSFEGLLRTEHAALYARKTRFDGQLCWTVKIATWTVDALHEG